MAAAIPTYEGHLTAAARERLGPPDVRLRAGGALFPAHRAVLALRSGLLRSLLEAFSCENEISLDGSSGEGAASGAAPAGAAAGAAAAAPAGAAAGGAAAGAALKALSAPALFERFLALLYAGAGGARSAGRAAAVIHSEDQALGLLELADYFDAPCVLPAVDSFLALAVAGLRTKLVFERSGSLVCDGVEVANWLVQASRYKLCRLAANCLPLIWSYTKFGGPGGDPAAFFYILNPLLLAATLEELAHSLQRRTGCPDDESNCSGAHYKLAVARARPPNVVDGRILCEKCQEHFKLEWRLAAERIESSLLKRGWGCA